MFLGLRSGILDNNPVSAWGREHITQIKTEANGNFRRFSRNGLDVIPQMLLPPTGHVK